MTVKGNKGKRYDREFKLGAVKLVLQEGKSANQVAKDLGVSEPAVRQWVAAAKRDNADAFPGSGRQTPQDEELKRLREELRVTRMERDILKKTIAYFAERPK
jgi:transposase